MGTEHVGSPIPTASSILPGEPAITTLDMPDTLAPIAPAPTLITAWTGTLKFIFIAAEVQDPSYDTWPADWKERILRRIFYDPDPTTGADGSLRTYIHTISSGKAHFDADLYGELVTVPGCGAGPPIQSVPTSHLYDVACVVFPGGSHNCRGMAVLRSSPFPYLDPPRSPNKLLGWCRFRIDESLGVWAMELMHAATGFDDLYKTQPHPQRYDVMACACGTHPSSFTKRKLNWIPSRALPIFRSSQRVTTLHAVSLPQPPPQGRVTGLRIPTNSLNRYFLAEARLKTDLYEQGVPGLSAGIPSEGVVVYEVDETVWAPMKLRTPAALGVGQSYVNVTDGLTIKVLEAVPGGFNIDVVSCEALRLEIEGKRHEIEILQQQLAMGGNKAAIIAQIKKLLDEIADLQQQVGEIGCTLPTLAIETYGADDSHLVLPLRPHAEPPASVPIGAPAHEPAAFELDEGVPPHRPHKRIELRPMAGPYETAK